MAVARLRVTEETTIDNLRMRQAALLDVAEWLGFKNSPAYLNTLNDEGASILSRATY